MKRALLIAGTGSEASPEVLRVVEAVRRRTDYDVVKAIRLEEGALAEGIASAAAGGATQVVVVPYVLALDTGGRDGLRRGVEEARRRHPGVEVAPAEPLGADERVADLVCDRARVAEMKMASAGAVLTVDGMVRNPLGLTYADLRAAPEQIEDVSARAPGRKGAGLRVETVLRKADPEPSAGQITFHSADGGFEASVSIQEARERGILIYRLGEDPLPEGLGGPVRLVIPGTEDVCNNVKQVVRVEVKA
ncbi:MAG: hypothetical protein A3F84_21210 [Candidatus Handelsmanbacteria bacterium RIFCSPLOWO2_12_FULL_64_10]|uniref:Oxidoreductase molybdopterin-binding domain-containing protein n=1 Tax=Handelsmanbacteria sp. (strain RIFCSPLOWO2_12_FULL_64_10) TaxID=1817868 RepID=A0A1F6D3E8_HANXR|nr:MAG: hypothetical protein A3F84_21210 [Candidatus Handelsmanbacteria bacterium RIFCSPLOWO2_12_FULL_64_10]